MKPYYYTFTWKERVITLCIVGEENEAECLYDLYLGYSVKRPLDAMNEELAKRIALGRAEKSTSNCWIVALMDNDDFQLTNDRGVLKAIAQNCERSIKKGTITIKGIR